MDGKQHGVRTGCSRHSYRRNPGWPRKVRHKALGGHPREGVDLKKAACKVILKGWVTASSTTSALSEPEKPAVRCTIQS